MQGVDFKPMQRHPYNCLNRSCIEAALQCNLSSFANITCRRGTSKTTFSMALEGWYYVVCLLWCLISIGTDSTSLIISTSTNRLSLPLPRCPLYKTGTYFSSVKIKYLYGVKQQKFSTQPRLNSVYQSTEVMQHNFSLKFLTCLPKTIFRRYEWCDFSNGIKCLLSILSLVCITVQIWI